MKVQDHIEEIKRHPNFSDVGMVVSHNGVVRSFTRDGRPTRSLTVEADLRAIERIRADIKGAPGIVDALFYVNEGRREVGDDVLIITVAGDIRENVFPMLVEAVNRVKNEALKKTEDLV